MTKKEITLYIADDGMTFATEEECLYHEAEIASHSATYRYRNLPRTNIALPFTEDDEFEYEAVYCTCQKDLDALKEAKYDPDCTAREYRMDGQNTAFPVWILCSYSGDGFGEIFGSIENVRELADDYLNAIEQKIAKMNKED